MTVVSPLARLNPEVAFRVAQSQVAHTDRNFEPTDRENTERVVIVVILTPRREALELFRAYEDQAAKIMAQYGGAIERIISIDDGREVHVVTFANHDAFRNYRAGPQLAALADLRQACIAHTDLLIGRDLA